MSEHPPKDTPSTEEWMKVWMKTATDFWNVMSRMWSAAGKDAVAPEGSIPTGRFQDFLTSSRKFWDAAAKAMSEPGSAEVFLKGMQTAPEISLRLFQTSADGFLELQKRWADRVQRLGASSEPYSFSDLDSEFLNRWTDIYKKEFRQFLNMPQLGLTRVYQEKMNLAVDKYHLLQAAMAEFLHLLSVPIEKSFRVMQDKLAELAETGKFSADSKLHYQMWIKITEGHYMTLFQSTQYIETLGKTLDAFNQFLAARNGVIEDALKLLPVATHRDLDEINREIYMLKKRIRALEKKRLSQ